MARTPIALALITVAAVACGTPAPSFSTPYDSVPADTLFAYITSRLQFDQRQWAGDSQRLMVGTCPSSCSHGPRVSIEPERRSHRNRSVTLEGDQGRIIARMINADTTPYPKFNLAGLDTVYWSVSRVVPAGGDTSWGQSMYISTRGLRGTHPTPVVYDSALVETHSHSYYPQQALARWIWSDTDEEKWGTCHRDGCCR
jgi:hypothetical protein